MELNEIINYVNKCGSDRVDVFGGSYEGGYHIQQNPYEISMAILKINEYYKEIDNYLEIGSAAGGTTRLISDFIKLKNVYIIDDNQHPKYKIRENNLKHLNTMEFIGDSHSIECQNILKQWNKKFDIVFIDGDHSYIGVKTDFEIIKEYIHIGSLILFHDTCINMKNFGPTEFNKEFKKNNYNIEHIIDIKASYLEKGISIFVKK